MEPTSIVYLSAEVIVGFMTVIGNCLVLTIIIRTPQLHTVTNVFVGNLAVADIVVGVLVAPCAALSYLGLPHNFYACVFINCLILMFTNVSILMLLAVAIERFIAIKEPFVYQRLLTVRRAIYANFFVWALGSALGLVPMYGWHRGYQDVSYCSFTSIISYEYLVYFQFFGLVLLPLFIMLCIYIYILLIVRKHMRQTNALHNQFRQSRDTKDTFSKDVKAAKMFALVILLFGIFWFPVNLFNCVSLFCGLDCPFPIQALLAAIVMSHANSSINPFLYAASNSRIKRGLKELFRIKLTPEERNTSEYNTKRPTTNGFSRVRDNSVAPMSSVADVSHHIDDGANPLTLPQKTSLPTGRISVLPIDQDLQNDNGKLEKIVQQAASETDCLQSGNGNIHSQENQANKLFSLLSPLANTEDIPESQRPASHHSYHDEHLQLNNSINSLQETNKSQTNLSSTQASHGHQHHNNESHLHQDGHYTVVHVKGASTDPIQDDSGHKTTCDKNENRDRQTFSSYNNDAADKRMSDSLYSKGDNVLCWTTSGSKDVNDGVVHSAGEPDIHYPRVLNGKHPSISMNMNQKTNSSGEWIEELAVNTLSGFVPSDRALSSLSHHRNNASRIRELTELVGEDSSANNNISNNIRTMTTGLKKEVSFKSSILVDEFDTMKNSEAEHTKL